MHDLLFERCDYFTHGIAPAIEYDVMTKLLMVCMGNICRSPMAQSVVHKLATASRLSQPLEIDSAGTHARNLGERPDPRAEAALARRGYEVGHGRSRRIVTEDFQRFDLILAMDTDNLNALRRLCPPEQVDKLRLFLAFADGLEDTEVPDPYYSNTQGFERVLDLCEAGARGLIQHYTL